MPLHDKAFWCIIFFLSGVLLASATVNVQSPLLITSFATLLVASFCALFGKQGVAILSLTILAGFFYYGWHDARQAQITIPYGEKTVLRALVVKTTLGLEKQDLVLDLTEPYRGKVKVTVGRHPAFHYGDEIEFKGIIRAPDARARERFLKDGISGLAGFPELTVLASHKGSKIKETLFAIKGFAEASFKKVLPPEEAVFLLGLTLGETGEFSKEFKEKLSTTGTSHLVALSGYNIAIVAGSVMTALGYFFTRRITFALGTLTIVLFVVMTGAEASVVRAAIMAGLVLLADQVGRVYSFRNAIAVAALLMVLVNPKILVWDVGFQLSFAAIVGLVYVKPALMKLLRISHEPGFLAWRENFWTTFSAQLAVLPILLGTFGAFSPISLLTNILVLLAVPFTMGLGFSIIALSALIPFFARIVGFVAHLFLRYEIGVIEFFSRFDVSLRVEHFGVFLSLFYYVLLAAITVFALRKRERYEIIF